MVVATRQIEPSCAFACVEPQQMGDVRLRGEAPAAHADSVLVPEHRATYAWSRPSTAKATTPSRRVGSAANGPVGPYTVTPGTRAGAPACAG